MLNNVVLMGRLTFEPELKVTQSGVSVVRFGIAVDRRYQQQNAEKKADFIDCVAWRQTAEFIEKYFHKGNMIAVEGSIQTENYVDQNGTNRKSVSVVANNVSFCGSKSESNAQNGNAPAQSSSQTYAPSDMDIEVIDDDDDLPF